MVFTMNYLIVRTGTRRLQARHPTIKLEARRKISHGLNCGNEASMQLPVSAMSVDPRSLACHYCTCPHCCDFNSGDVGLLQMTSDFDIESIAAIPVVKCDSCQFFGHHTHDYDIERPHQLLSPTSSKNYLCTLANVSTQKHLHAGHRNIFCAAVLATKTVCQETGSTRAGNCD
jgi:hypothetical protein